MFIYLFFFFFYFNYFFFFFFFFFFFVLNLNTDISRQYSENCRKIEQAELVENLSPHYLPYRFLHNLHSFLLWEKVKIFDLKKTTTTKKKEKNND